MHYYNENNREAAAWLRELMKAGEIPAGVIDERSICDVQPNELSGYVQCHFFAGIGGWPLALRLAGWPEDRPVWTGSCPCQPFSQTGLKLGTKDSRHLWPVLRKLIGRCGPAIVFGEQVASKLGRAWISGVRANLARLDYALGAADLCAAGIGSPQIRQRLYWMAYRQGQRWKRRQDSTEPPRRPFAKISGSFGGLGDSHGQGSQGRQLGWDGGNQRIAGATGVDGFWSSYDILPCRDHKARRVESGTFPLAHGVPGRVGLLRGYGNAIVPPLAALFIQASVEAIGDSDEWGVTSDQRETIEKILP